MKKTSLAVLILMSAGPVFAAGTGWTPASTGNTPTTGLPAAPGTAPVTVQTGPASVSTATAGTQNPPAPPAGPDMTAPLRDSAPPAPPTSSEAYAIGQVAPLNKDQVESLSVAVDQEKRGRAYQPVDTVPRISTLTVSLAPGASLPLLRTAVNQPSSVMFTDSTGAPWPLAAPPYNGNSDGFTVSFIPDSSVMVVQAKRQYDRGNVTVYLKGLPVPVIVDVTSGEPDSTQASWTVDSRLDLRLPQRGPQAKALPAGESKTALYDATLQAFLDGVPPKDARRLKTQGNVPDTQVWQLGDDLFIRTRSELRDQFEQTLSSGDGTTLYKLPLTPDAAFSVAGKTVYLALSLE